MSNPLTNLFTALADTIRRKEILCKQLVYELRELEKKLARVNSSRLSKSQRLTSLGTSVAICLDMVEKINAQFISVPVQEDYEIV